MTLLWSLQRAAIFRWFLFYHFSYEVLLVQVVTFAIVSSKLSIWLGYLASILDLTSLLLSGFTFILDFFQGIKIWYTPWCWSRVWNCIQFNRSVSIIPKMLALKTGQIRSKQKSKHVKLSNYFFNRRHSLVLLLHAAVLIKMRVWNLDNLWSILAGPCWYRCVSWSKGSNWSTSKEGGGPCSSLVCWQQVQAEEVKGNHIFCLSFHIAQHKYLSWKRYILSPFTWNHVGDYLVKHAYFHFCLDKDWYVENWSIQESPSSVH